ncbi:MAG: O-antigen ligase family protein [Thermodesulfobacteriota bacterium]
MLFLIALALAAISLSILTLRPETGFLVLTAFKPIIDASWEHQFLGFNVLEIVGGTVPIIIIAHMILNKKKGILNAPAATWWFFYLFSSLIGVLMMLIAGKMIEVFDFYFKVLNGFIGYFLLQYFFDDSKSFKRLLIALMLAGIFPMLMGLYQAQTGVVWRERVSVGVLRNVGIYHDEFSLRSFSLLTIMSIMLYWSYFTDRKIAKKLVLIGYSAICLVVLYKVHSKAGYLIITSWIFIWCIWKKKPLLLVGMIMIVLAANLILENRIFTSVATIFSKETGFLEGTGTEMRILAGRLYLWEDLWEYWIKQDLLHKFLGTGRSGGGAHNDYLRVLVSTGILGLAIYVTLLTIMAWKVFLNLLKNNNSLNLMAFMLMVMWLIDTIGLVPSLYPAYQWYVWGFIGLSLRGVKDLVEPAQKSKALNLTEARAY